VRSTGVFRRFHLGGNGAAHGGTLPLLFDDLFGLIQHAYGHPISRTAFLHIDYRAVTPLNEQLVAEGHVTKVEGRKTFIEARLTKQDGTLVAERHRPTGSEDVSVRSVPSPVSRADCPSTERARSARTTSGPTVIPGRRPRRW